MEVNFSRLAGKSVEYLGGFIGRYSGRVSFDWDSRDFKITSGYKIKNSYYIDKYVYENYDVSRDDIPSLIKKIWQENKLSLSNVFLSLAGPSTLIRTLDFPKMSKPALKESLRYELPKYVPFSVEEVYYDFYVFPAQDNNETMKVLVALAKKDFLDEKINLLNQAGIYPRYVNLSPVVLANLFRKFYSYIETPCAIIDMGFSYCLVNIIYKGMLVFSREIKKSGLEILERVSARLNIHLEKFIDLGSKNIVLHNDVIFDIMGDFIDEIKMTLDYLETENNIEVKRVYITGGLTFFKNAHFVLNKVLNIEVLYFNVVDFFSGSEKTRKGLKQLEGSFAVSIGGLL